MRLERRQSHYDGSRFIPTQFLVQEAQQATALLSREETEWSSQLPKGQRLGGSRPREQHEVNPQDSMNFPLEVFANSRAEPVQALTASQSREGSYLGDWEAVGAV